MLQKRGSLYIQGNVFEGCIGLLLLQCSTPLGVIEILALLW